MGRPSTTKVTGVLARETVCWLSVEMAASRPFMLNLFTSAAASTIASAAMRTFGTRSIRPLAKASPTEMPDLSTHPEPENGPSFAGEEGMSLRAALIAFLVADLIRRTVDRMPLANVRPRERPELYALAPLMPAAATLATRRPVPELLYEYRP